MSDAVERPLAPLLPGVFANESLPAPSCALLMRLRRSLANHETGQRLYSQTRRLLQEAIANFEFSRLGVPHAWLPRIEASAGHNWNETLALTRSDAAIMDRFRIQMIPGLDPITGDEIEDWLLSGNDPAFVQFFASFCRGRPEPFAVRVAEAVRALA